MKKQARINRNIARAKAVSIAVATAIVCAGMWLPGLAQTGAGATKALVAGDRNLQLQPAVAQKINNSQRVALVIGNAAYKDAPLTNPVNDARAIVLALQESGFSVIARENIDQRAMLAVLREFGDRLRGGGTGLFYYAGHGMQIKGRNYLIPVGANIDREDEVAYSAVDAQAVLDKMEAAGNVANIMILDACRNNPFTRSMRSGQAGLAQMDAPVGTLLAYATSPGAVASDGGGANGLYTQHLLTAIRQPGSKVEDVFKQVRANVRRDSQGKQVPWESTSLEGDFYFKGGPLATTPVDPAQEAELALWNAVKDSKVPIELRVYLNRYPIGKFATVALARLDQLQRTATEQASAEASRKAAAERATAEASQKAAAERARAEASQKSAAERVAAEAKQKAAAERSAVEAARKDAAERAATEANERAAIQAAVDKRTEELLASLAAPAVAPAATKPAAGKPARPAALSNGFGFTVGDRWRYQNVDRWKQEVVSNSSFAVSKILANGDMEWNEGKMLTSPDGNWRRHSPNTYSPLWPWKPKEMRVGYQEDIDFVINASDVTQRHRGTLVVKGREKIKVPAGEFEAYRIERTTDVNGVATASGNQSFGYRTSVFWYVPELLYFIAFDDEYRVGGRLVMYSRQELTSFSVHRKENLAQR
jgi:pyruvate/2-oxoglutarate dehydrogenase complex dihydrolipoamide acyltransferase (E2) component